MTCKPFDFIKFDRETGWIYTSLHYMPLRCLEVLSGSETWCYEGGSWGIVSVAIDIRYLKKVEEALRWCIEVMRRDVELAEAFISGKKPESYPQFEKELGQILKLLGEINPSAVAMKNIKNYRPYKLAKIYFYGHYAKIVQNKLANELARINPEIKVYAYSPDYPDIPVSAVVFKYRGKRLIIGKVSLWGLLESVEFVATEEKAVEDILEAVRRALPKHAKKFEEAVEKLRLLKKLLQEFGDASNLLKLIYGKT